jgi:tRNA (guanine-N7-)-methyltransferase
LSGRFRQHVNPLKRELQEPTQPLDWSRIYVDPLKPLILDIGAGYGRFLLGMMQVEEFAASHNGLGLEIREPIIKRANEWAVHLGLNSRVHFEKSNATVSIESMLSTYPGPVELVTIQFPDPHFKKRHRKRRIVQQGLVRDLAGVVGVGGRVLLQSDVLAVAEDMRDKFEQYGDGKWVVGSAHDNVEGVFFEESEEASEEASEEESEEARGEGAESVALEFKGKGWLKANILPVRTERECLVMEQGGSVYRVVLERVGNDAI